MSVLALLLLFSVTLVLSLSISLSLPVSVCHLWYTTFQISWWCWLDFSCVSYVSNSSSRLICRGSHPSPWTWFLLPMQCETSSHATSTWRTRPSVVAYIQRFDRCCGVTRHKVIPFALWYYSSQSDTFRVVVALALSDTFPVVEIIGTSG